MIRKLYWYRYHNNNLDTTVALEHSLVKSYVNSLH